MEKYKIDERTGWEYELQGDYYYPTGRVLRGGVMMPEEFPKDDEPKRKCRSEYGDKGICGIYGRKKRLCILNCSSPEG